MSKAMSNKSIKRIKITVVLVLLIIAAFLLTGCQTYNERFTYYDPAGQTNHVVHVSYRTFLTWGEAAKLQTSTQTEEFIRTVNAEGVTVKGDSEAIRALGSAIGETAGTILKTTIAP